MFFALAEDGTKIRPGHSGQRARCPGCGNEVVARCGRIVIDHWSHLSGVECDSWYESMSLWHLSWQVYLIKKGASVEVKIEKNGSMHLADAVLKNGTIVELQHSYLSVDKIEERESFYQNMIWVFDARKAFSENRFDSRDRVSHHTFRWKHPRKSIAFAKCPVRLDLGGGKIFQLKNMHQEAPCGGSGKLIQIPELAFECYDGA